MILRQHLCGVAVAFERHDDHDDYFEDEKYNPYAGSNEGREQGSLYSWQKRKIADACEFMRQNATYKPLIFVATSPGYTDQAQEKSLISKLTHNLRNGYGCKNYVWVREFTERGFPHFHFIADMPRVDAVTLSLYWSRLFGSNAANSIRFGTGQGRNKKRTFYLTHERQAWYLTKYLSKSIGQCERGAIKGKSFRTFAVSQELARLSQPVEYKSKMVRVNTGRMAYHVSGQLQPFTEDVRQWQQIDQETGEVKTVLHDDVVKRYNWQYTGFANTWKGYPKQWKLKNRKK
jgi:hypothetical protein